MALIDSNVNSAFIMRFHSPSCIQLDLSLHCARRQARDDADFGETGEGTEAAADGDGEAGGASAGSGLPWDGDDSRDYTYEELLGAPSLGVTPCQRLAPSSLPSF